MATASFTASMITRKNNSSSNYKSGSASQEFYTSGTNFVGVICFSGMSLANKVITGISFSISADKAGYVGASSFASWNDSSGNDRRMLEVRNSSYESNIDNAVMVRTCDGGTWGNYRVFHAGMATGVPIANGGTGATTAATARSNLGCNNASNLTSGTVAAARLPFKVAYGSSSCNGSTAATINYSGAGFTAVPTVVVSYSTTSTNWSGDNGALKIYSKTKTGCNVIVGGSFSTSRNIDWIAIGV